ncbi:hypothetical protein cypCar_00029277 [Cyprinus carpio]|nr:hypothetical protein cypCar_00029277 [Cyprinus carpio]
MADSSQLTQGRSEVALSAAVFGLSVRRRCEAGPAGTERESRGLERRMAAVGAAAAEAESSDSEPEQEHGSPQKLIRKVSTSGQIRSKTILKEGKLMKQTNFQRWKRRYFKLRGRTLYYAQTAKSIIFDEVDLTDASVAESSTKNVNNSFTISMPHQWLEGNLPVSAKCTVCDKTCGSVLRLQDCRCLWCKAMVHAGCKDQLSPKCPLGQCKVSVIPPTALNSIDSDVTALPVFVCLCVCRSLRLFQKFDTFRILVCGGDGSVGWVLSEIDALTLHKQCQLGVLPLGTGNDLARVLGWGSACDDDTQLPQILEKLERASTKMLDRWSIMVYETKLPRQHSSSTVTEDCSEDSEVQHILTYEDSVAAHLSKILTSDQHSVVISSAKVLCETVKDFVAKVGRAYERNTENSEESEAMAKKCGVLKEKLDSLLKTLNEEAQASSVMSAPPPTIAEEQVDGEGVVLAPPTAPPTVTAPCSPRPPAAIFKPREQLMLRANSLKKAIRQIIEHTEKAVDEQNAQTEEGLPSLPAEEEEEDDGSETLSLQSSYSSRARASRRASKTPCEKLISKGSLSIGSSASLPAQTGSRENMPMLNTKILYPSLRAGVSGSFSGSVITRLLVNADPFNYDPENLDLFTEKCVMNNYFGIGLDAKISLDFNNKRVPVQVDGEAWIQPPGYIRILHKNRTQTLTRDRAFENTLKSWEDKQRGEIPRLVSQHASQPEIVSEEETAQISLFGQAAGALIHSIRDVAQSHHTIEQELAHAVNASSKAMDLVYANSKSSGGLTCNVVMEMVSNVKALHSETELLLAGKMCLVLHTYDSYVGFKRASMAEYFTDSVLTRFVLLAYDGLFKVFSADEAIQFILSILEQHTVLLQVMKLCAQMVEAGQNYTSCNQLFLSGLAEFTAYHKSDGVIVNCLRQFNQGLQEMIQFQTIRDTRREFVRIGEDLEAAVVKNAQVSRHKPADAERATHLLLATRKCYQHFALDYCLQLNNFKVQQKLDILNSVFSYFHAQNTFFHQGFDLLRDLEPTMKTMASQLSQLSSDCSAKRKDLENTHLLVQQRVR